MENVNDFVAELALELGASYDDTERILLRNGMDERGMLRQGKEKPPMANFPFKAAHGLV